MFGSLKATLMIGYKLYKAPSILVEQGELTKSFEDVFDAREINGPDIPDKSGSEPLTISSEN